MRYGPQQIAFVEGMLAEAIDDLGPIRRRVLSRRLSRDDSLREDLVARIADELHAKQQLPAEGQEHFITGEQLEAIFEIIRKLLPLLIKLFGLFG